MGIVHADVVGLECRASGKDGVSVVLEEGGSVAFFAQRAIKEVSETDRGERERSHTAGAVVGFGREEFGTGVVDVGEIEVEAQTLERGEGELGLKVGVVVPREGALATTVGDDPSLVYRPSEVLFFVSETKHISESGGGEVTPFRQSEECPCLGQESGNVTTPTVSLTERQVS